MTGLRVNPLINALKGDLTQVGTWVNMVHSPAILALLQSAGLDYVRLDMEHSAPSIETVASMALVARALGFPMLVRPPSASREWVTRLLDVGVWGLHIPQVDTPEIAAGVVEAARYAPTGMRGMAGLGPHNDFTPATSTAAMDQQVHITVMLESKRAFSHLDEIVGMAGIDAVTLGPHDLAQDLGVVGAPDEKQVIDSLRLDMIDSAKRHHKQVAMLCNTVEDAVRWAKNGVQMIVYSTEVDVLFNGYASIVSRVRQGLSSDA